MCHIQNFEVRCTDGDNAVTKQKVKIKKDKEKDKDKDKDKDKEKKKDKSNDNTSADEDSNNKHVLHDDDWNKQQQICITSLSQFDPSLRYDNTDCVFPQ